MLVWRALIGWKMLFSQSENSNSVYRKITLTFFVKTISVRVVNVKKLFGGIAEILDFPLSWNNKKMLF